MSGPKVTPVKGGHSVRLRYGKGFICRFKIAIVDPAQAAKRRDVMAEMAQNIAKSGHSDHGFRLLASAGSASDEEIGDLRKLAAKLAEGKARPMVAPAQRITFGALADDWTSGRLHKKYPDHVKQKRSAADDIGRLKKLKEEIGEIALAAFTIEDAEQAMRALPEGLSPATRRHYAQLIAKVLKLAVYPCKIIAASPLPTGFLPPIKGSKAKAWLYPDEDRKLMGATGDVALESRMLWGFLAREGLRLGEALALRWRDLDLERGVIRLDENKTDDPRAWALDPGVTRALAAFRPDAAPDSAPVFRLMTDPASAARDFRGHLKAAGVTRAELFESNDHRMAIRVHDLRGTFVTLSLANGKTEQWVSDRTGHGSSVMINRYRRAARSAEELGLGSLEPLDQALPEFCPAKGDPQSDPQPKSAETIKDLAFPPSPLFSAVVAPPGVEPGCLAARDFKSPASAIPPRGQSQR